MFEETALELYCHKDVRMALPAQRTMWQDAVLMIANAKKEKPGRVCAEGSPFPYISLIPSRSPQPWTLHRLGAASGRCRPKSQHQSPMNFSTSFFSFFVHLFHILLASTGIFNHDFYNLIMHFILWNLKCLFSGTVSWSSSWDSKLEFFGGVYLF